jgi:hypothetical protein
MNLTLIKRAINRDGVNGLAIELMGDGVKLAGADLRLPADDAAVKAIVDILARQSEAMGVMISGRKLPLLCQQIETGAVV